MIAKYTRDDLICVAKRENNTKRNYLYVNPLQGKHVPVSPTLSLELFTELSSMLSEKYRNEKLLMIGFAETATAIGTAVACGACNVKYYLSTTREEISGVQYLFFTESHSHATEQRLVTDGLPLCLQNVDRIVFAEDEVTTGNTIESLINAIRDAYPGYRGKFGIISILNSFSDERAIHWKKLGVECEFLFHIPYTYRAEEVEKYDYLPLSMQIGRTTTIAPQVIQLGGLWNERIVCETWRIREQCSRFIEDCIKRIPNDLVGKRLLILGTEEFMYPAMLLGRKIEQDRKDCTVRFHATTRSPIEISDGKGYPLHKRAALESIYSSERATFLYNLEKYDLVILVTDASSINETGLTSIVAALEAEGNKNIVLIKWRRS